MEKGFFEEYSVLIDEMTLEIRKKMSTPLSLLVQRAKGKDDKTFTNIQISILATIFHNNGIIMKDLAKRCGVSYKNLSTPVKGLEKLGYLRQEVDSEDRRCIHVYYTDICLDLLTKIENVGIELSKQIFEKNLNEQELIDLYNATKTVRDFYSMMPQVYVDTKNNIAFE